MSSKRDLSDIDDGEVPEPVAKRSRKKPRQHQNSSIDPTWGQKYVFSSHDDATTVPVGQESEFEDDTDAMAYLKSVRNEALGIPHLLVAPKKQIGPQLPADFERDDDHEAQDDEIDRSIYQNGIGDSRGFYHDGAYTAMPEPTEKEPDDQEEGEVADQDEEASEKAIHEAYFTTISKQFEHIRSIVNLTPPDNASSRLDTSHPTQVNAFSKQAAPAHHWSKLIHKTDPHPVQLALMPKESVLRLLRIILGGKFLRQGYPVPERTSRWLWALLARLPEKGELNYSEIGWVRDLGRRAVLLGRSLAEMAALREALEDGNLGVHEGVDGSESDDNMGEGEDLEEGVQSLDEETDETAPTSDILPDEAGERSRSKAAPTVRTAESEKEGANEDPDPDQEDGEISDVTSDVAMSISSEGSETLEDRKTRLLADIDASTEEDNRNVVRDRDRMNMRATLNMILTVVGEFYGQRDLLAFREPFVGM